MLIAELMANYWPEIISILQGGVGITFRVFQR
jgi:hypothetical protein